MRPSVQSRAAVCQLLLSLLTLASASFAYAGAPTTVAKTVYAQVLKVVPLHRSVTHCSLTDKPSQSQGLAAQLRWDFNNQCTVVRPEVQTYEVTYTWDGRTYTEKLSYNPGKHIPLEVRYR